MDLNGNLNPEEQRILSASINRRITATPDRRAVINRSQELATVMGEGLDLLVDNLRTLRQAMPDVPTTVPLSLLYVNARMVELDRDIVEQLLLAALNRLTDPAPGVPRGN